MSELEKASKSEQLQEKDTKFSEINGFNHVHNQVAAAQKQMSSQETTGLLDQE